MTVEQWFAEMTFGERRDFLDWLERCVAQFQEKGPGHRASAIAQLLRILERL